MSLGGTWTSPRLERATRRAVSPLRGGVRAELVAHDDRNDDVRRRPPSAPLPRSEIIRRRVEPTPSKTIDALSNPAAAQFSSFTPDGCFPAAVGVRNPLRAATSPMTSQVAARKRRQALRAAMAVREQERDATAAELDRVRGCSRTSFRPPTPMSEYTPSRPPTSGAVGAFDLGGVVPPGASDDDDAMRAGSPVPIAEMYPSSRPPSSMVQTAAIDRGNAAQTHTEVPVLRVETPIPGHPLAGVTSASHRAGGGGAAGHRPASAATATTTTPAGAGTAAPAPTRSPRPGTAAAVRAASAVAALRIRPGSAATTAPSRPTSAAAPTAAPTEEPEPGVPTGPSFTGSTLAVAAAATTLGPGVRSIRKALQWQLRKTAGSTPATSAAVGGGEDSAMNAETLMLLQRPSTPGLVSRPLSAAPADDADGDTLVAAATRSSAAINTMLRERRSASASPAVFDAGAAMGVTHPAAGSDAAYRPLRAFVV